MKKEIITHLEPTSSIAEIFKTLRTNLQFMTANKNLRTLLVTSTMPGEGKSWISANLAVAFAQAGKRVILVDADMRKGRQNKMFEVPLIPGLSNYLSGIGENQDKPITIYDCIKKTPVKNLSVIPSGNIPPNPSELLITDKMNNMIEELKELADIIIFDGTPSLLVTDAIIISRMVDSTMIVTAQKETKIDDLEKIKKEIENVGGKIAGVVLNKKSISTKKYNETYYYGNGNKKHKKRG